MTSTLYSSWQHYSSCSIKICLLMLFLLSGTHMYFYSSSIYTVTVADSLAYECLYKKICWLENVQTHNCYSYTHTVTGRWSLVRTVSNFKFKSSSKMCCPYFIRLKSSYQGLPRIGLFRDFLPFTK